MITCRPERRVNARSGLRHDGSRYRARSQSLTCSRYAASSRRAQERERLHEHLAEHVLAERAPLEAVDAASPSVVGEPFERVVLVRVALDRRRRRDASARCRRRPRRSSRRRSDTGSRLTDAVRISSRRRAPAHRRGSGPRRFGCRSPTRRGSARTCSPSVACTRSRSAGSPRSGPPCARARRRGRHRTRLDPRRRRSPRNPSTRRLSWRWWPLPSTSWKGIGMNVARTPCRRRPALTTYFRIAALSAASIGEAGPTLTSHCPGPALGLARLDGDARCRAASNGSRRGSASCSAPSVIDQHRWSS